MSCCWWCRHTFPSEPLCLPISYNEKTKQYETVGNFCDWACMKAFNLQRHGTFRGGIIGQHILLMRKEMTGLTTPIEAAPDYLALDIFGGPLTIDEFRKTPGVNVRVSMPFEIKRALDIQILAEKEDLVGIPVTMPGSGQGLVLKRPKPLKRHENSLEKSLGIFKKKS